ncbi:MAG TPA: PA2779 family protein [Burkholderiales bacterium]|nr:PA2779 family protein [Burkholderiales bacterium]
MNAINRCVARALIACVLGWGLPPSSFAGIVATDEVQASVERDRVKSLLERAEVRAELEALGVKPGAALARVDALSEEEVAQLMGHLDQLPAGGSDVLTVALIVFLVLLFTDIMGYTKIFPFTRPAQK